MDIFVGVDTFFLKENQWILHTSEAFLNVKYTFYPTLQEGFPATG